jgi:A118 family predicted phage portal protein
MFEGIRKIIQVVQSAMFEKKQMDSIAKEETALTSPMIKAIDLWDKMLKGEAPWCDDYIKSLHIEGGIASEFANVCTSEMESSVSVSKLDDEYQFVVRDLNENMQDGLALGSFIIKPLGADFAGAEYVTPDKFIPVRYDAKGRLIDVIFVDARKKTESLWYIRFERHVLIDNKLTVTNEAYQAQGKNKGLGSQIPLSTVPDWADLSEEDTFEGVERPIFGYYRNPLKNRIDGSAVGVSMYHAAADIIEKADTQFGRIDWEFESGERALYVDPTAINPETKNINRLNKKLYREAAADQGAGKELFKEFSPELRDESLINGLNEYLRRVEFAVGLSYGDLSDVQIVAKTATEISASKERKFRTVRSIETNLKDCLDDLVYALAFWCGLTSSGYEFICDFHDSILTDEDAENLSMREDVAAGIIKPEKYIAKKYGVDEDAAGEWMPGQAAPPGMED